MKLQWHDERLHVSWARQQLSNIRQLQFWHTLFLTPSHSTFFFFMPCGCRFHNKTVPTGRHTQTCTHIMGAVKHDVSLLWFLRQWNYTCSFMAKKGWKRANKLVHEQKQYDRNCISAFIWIVNRNIKREIIALNAYKIISTV